MITRVEYRKKAKANRRKEDRSLKEALLSIRNESLKYFARYSVYLKTEKDAHKSSYNKRDLVTESSVKKRKKFAKTMMCAYVERLEQYGSMEEVAKALYLRF